MAYPLVDTFAAYSLRTGDFHETRSQRAVGIDYTIADSGLSVSAGKIGNVSTTCEVDRFSSELDLRAFRNPESSEQSEI